MIEFIDDFHTEEQCLTALEEIRWSWACPKCGCTEYWRHGKRRVRICSGCKATLCVTAGTVLDRLRIPLRALFLLWWFMVTSKQGVSAEELSSIPLRALFLLWWFMVTSKQGVSAEELSSLLGISPPTAWLWNQKFRRIMVREDREKLTGNVEVDEVFVWGKQSWLRWRWAKGKNIVVVAVEINMTNKSKQGFFRGMGRVRMQVIPNCGEQTLTSFIQKNIEPWSTIYTDKWSSYNTLDKKGYTHILQSESITDDAVTGVYTTEVTPNVHIVASLVKRWLLGTHQKYCTKGGYLQDYLEEYTFRFNRRRSSDRWKLFQTLLEQVLSHSPTTKDSIRKHLARNIS